MATIPPLFDRLVDDAAVFPPGNLPLPAAVTAHRQHRAAWYAPFVGPLLCPASSLDELARLARQDAEPLGVAVVVDTGTGGVLEAVDAVARREQLVLRGVEVPLRGSPLAESARRTVAALDAALGGPDDDEPAYVEVPREPGWQAALDVVADSGYRAKLRTGGADPSAHPSAAELAAFVLACLDRGVVFKFTAGLHRAVRHHIDIGADEHGFLDIILAVAAALDGGDQDAVSETLMIDDGAELAAAVGALPGPRAASVRQWFASYGSCSIDEPLTDLIALGMISSTDTVTP